MSNNVQKDLVTQIQANEKLVDSNERAMAKVRLHTQCTCTHRDSNGAFALIPPSHNGKRSRRGNPVYRCRICKKELDISNIAEDAFNDALDILNSVYDLGKMHLDLKSEKDRKTLRRLSKQQYKMNAVMPDVYRVIRKGGKKKDKGNNSQYAGIVNVSR